MCLKPYPKKMTNTRGEEKIQNLPCGYCYECRMKRVQDWAFRLHWQSKQDKIVHFVTITYDEEHITWGDGEQTLVKSEAKAFVKALRKREPNLKYYLAGEYGTRTKRPHYHLITYNVQDITNIHKAWGKGQIHAPELESGAGITYTLKYLMKESNGGKYNTPTKEKEFQLMSKNLGLNYLTKETIAFHQASEKNCYTIHNGYKISLPRYYKKLIMNETLAENIADYQTVRAHKKHEEFVKKHERKDNPGHWLKIQGIRNEHKKFEQLVGIF